MQTQNAEVIENKSAEMGSRLVPFQLTIWPLAEDTFNLCEQCDNHTSSIIQHIDHLPDENVEMIRSLGECVTTRTART